MLSHGIGVWLSSWNFGKFNAANCNPILPQNQGVTSLQHVA